MSRKQHNNKRKVNDNYGSSEIPTKQTKLFVTSTPTQPNQSKIDSLIVDYIVESMSLLSIVEKRGFVALDEGFAPGSKVTARKTFSARINAKFD